MGIYIKGMEMPKSCFYCPFRKKVNPDDCVCMAMNREFEETFALIAGRRHKDCPLVEVPDHGDLIDRDLLLNNVDADVLEDRCDYAIFGYSTKQILTQPAVISANKEEVKE